MISVSYGCHIIFDRAKVAFKNAEKDIFECFLRNDKLYSDV